MRTWAAGLAVLLLVAGTPSPAAGQYHRYRGAIHIHTLHSDGSGAFEEVVKAGQAAGLEYMIFTDHNTLKPLQEGHQRYWDRTLVLVGTEISTDAGHCLGLDLPASFPLGATKPQTVIDRVKAAGGFTILAHPMSPRWSWKDWNVTGYTGIEIINLASVFDDDLLAATEGIQVQGRSMNRLLELAQRYVANPDRTMTRLTNNDVERERNQWDKLLRQGRQVVGIGAVDAHARLPVAGREFKAPTYQEAFESVQSYVVTPEPLRREVEADRKLIYSAYRNGRLYTVYPRVAAAPEFSFTAREGDREAIMGQPIRIQQQVRLVVEAPGHSHPVIRLLHNGTEVASAEEKRLEWTATRPGAYRVEVYAGVRQGRLLDPRRGLRLPKVEDVLRSRRRELRPWIFSNPIYVRR